MSSVYCPIRCIRQWTHATSFVIQSEQKLLIHSLLSLCYLMLSRIDGFVIKLSWEYFRNITPCSRMQQISTIWRLILCQFNQLIPLDCSKTWKPLWSNGHGDWWLCTIQWQGPLFCWWIRSVMGCIVQMMLQRDPIFLKMSNNLTGFLISILFQHEEFQWDLVIKFHILWECPGGWLSIQIDVKIKSVTKIVLIPVTISNILISCYVHIRSSIQGEQLHDIL